VRRLYAEDVIAGLDGGSHLPPGALYLSLTNPPPFNASIWNLPQWRKAVQYPCRAVGRVVGLRRDGIYGVSSGVV
jgi:hypothetical protein